MPGRATLAQKPLLQDCLDVASTVQHAMYIHGRGLDGIDDAVGIMVQFPELKYADIEEFRGRRCS